ncbi:unnamed protein product [Echinostoma caproni]|uniref:GST N-terminal domain-containing protein n=1 Tax=Echinostoma caproni TaxID=27848 RepID=A0A183BEB1_9TREM|nr:unnamed protein product [Echinostoma caproni]
METASLHERIPPLMAPEKLVPGEDFDVSESQILRYVRNIPSPFRADADFNLPDDVDNLLVTLRWRLAGPKTSLEYWEEFYVRQQRPEESLMNDMGSVLGWHTPCIRTSPFLDRFLAGLREPRAKDELQLRPPKDLAAAESIADILDRNGHLVRQPQGVFPAGFSQEGRTPTRENGERKPSMVPTCYTCRQTGHTSRFRGERGDAYRIVAITSLFKRPSHLSQMVRPSSLTMVPETGGKYVGLSKNPPKSVKCLDWPGVEESGHYRSSDVDDFNQKIIVI